MFGLLNRSSRTRKPLARRSTTLRLERLEDRLCLSTVAQEGITLNVTYLPGKEAILSGHLSSYGNPIANEPINLTGVVKTSATTDSQGNYSITVGIPQLGNEMAADANGKSNTALFTLQGGSPTIQDFTAVAEGNGVWLFSGSVTNAPAQGEVVNFGGITPLEGQSTAVNADGSFAFYATVPSGQGGIATAEAVDWWGDTSEIASDYCGA